MVAAVVIPTNPPASRRIAPAPRKPMPWTMFEAIRVLPESPKRCAISPERIVNKAVARQTNRLVRIPAGRRRKSRSMPMTAPNAAATVSRNKISRRESIASGTHGPPERNSSHLQFELRQFREVACPGVYLASLQVAQPIKAELFDRKAPQHRAEDHGAAQRSVTLIPTTRQVAHEAAGEAVACAGGIVRLFEWKRRHAEDPALVHHHGPVLSALHDQRRRSHLENVLGRSQQIMFAGKLAGLRIIDHQDVDVFQRLPQFRIRALDPIVHGIQRRDFWALLDLEKHIPLQVRRDVGEEYVL